MFEKELKNCNRILKLNDYPRITANIRTTNEYLSYTDCINTIYIGRLVRIIPLINIVKTILHEHVHILIYKFTPSATIKRAFGSPKDWASPQKFSNILKPYPQTITFYARTHPEEDMVDTCVIGMLTPQKCPPEKLSAINRWKKQFKQR